MRRALGQAFQGDGKPEADIRRLDGALSAHPG